MPGINICQLLSVKLLETKVLTGGYSYEAYVLLVRYLRNAPVFVGDIRVSNRTFWLLLVPRTFQLIQRQGGCSILLVLLNSVINNGYNALPDGAVAGVF